jgi:hypothetical protein
MDITKQSRVLVIALILAAGQALAQPQGPGIEWYRPLHMDVIYTATDLVRTNSGDLYLSGYYATGDFCDIFLTKLNSRGDSLWTQHYGWPDRDDVASRMCLAPNGDLLLAGGVYPNGSTNEVPTLFRVSPSGDLLWQRSYERFQVCLIRDVISVRSGGFAMCGHAFPYPMLMRVNENGDTLWWQVYDSLLVWMPNLPSLCQTSDDGFLLVGGGAPDSTGIWIMKVDSTGRRQFERYYPFESYCVVTSVVEMLGGGFMLSCYYEVSDPLTSGWCLVRTNAQGDTVWTRRSLPMRWVMPGAMCLMEDGGVVIAGDIYLDGQEMTYLDRWDSAGTAFGAH